MTGHVSTERMNEALDGLLSAAEMDRLDAHVDGCDRCRNEYARLSELVVAVRALPRSAAAPDDAWEGIAARIAAPGSRDDSAGGDLGVVVPFPTRVEGRPVRMFSLSARQLATAAAAVAILSAGSVWLSMQPGTERGETAAVSEPLAGAAARAVSLDDTRYSEVVGQLERILEDGRAVLAPETLLTIEESLRTVDEAIEDIETALADDPGSDLLLRMLATHRSTRLGVLQRAATAVQAQT